jgi:hypothetical protein
MAPQEPVGELAELVAQRIDFSHLYWTLTDLYGKPVVELDVVRD